MNEGTDARSAGNITSFLKNTENNQQTRHTEKMKLVWRHPTKGEISELLCESHYEEVIFSLKKLGIGYTGNIECGVCLRCIYIGFDVRTWLGK